MNKGRPINIWYDFSMKRLLYLFLFSFLLNLVWENLHSYLYDNYMGGRIAEFILLRATFADAVMVTLICLPFVYIKYFNERRWIMPIFGITLAIFIEKYALSTARWAYNPFMPLIPILNVGLTPTIQLGLIGYLSYRLVYST